MRSGQRTWVWFSPRLSFFKNLLLTIFRKVAFKSSNNVASNLSNKNELKQKTKRTKQLPSHGYKWERFVFICLQKKRFFIISLKKLFFCFMWKNEKTEEIFKTSNSAESFVWIQRQTNTKIFQNTWETEKIIYLSLNLVYRMIIWHIFKSKVFYHF